MSPRSCTRDQVSDPPRKGGARRRGIGAAIAVTGITTVLSGCGGNNGANPPSAAGSAKQTIVFAEAGLGTEGQQTQRAINEFERANPNIKVTIQSLSPNSTTYLQQLQQRFIAGSSTPDVLESDVTYPAKFAQAGWIRSLNEFSPDTGKFFATAVAAGQYKGSTYAIPWFENPEGLFYRTDLVPTKPTTPQAIVSDAKAAMQKDPSLKEGLAFEGKKYEGAVTAYMTVTAPFGGKVTGTNINSPGNVNALNWLQQAIYTNKIAPLAVTGWEESQVQENSPPAAPRSRSTTRSSRRWHHEEGRPKGTSASFRFRRRQAGNPERRSAARCLPSMPRAGTRPMDTNSSSSSPPPLCRSPVPKPRVIRLLCPPRTRGSCTKRRHTSSRSRSSIATPSPGR